MKRSLHTVSAAVAAFALLAAAAPAGAAEKTLDELVAMNLEAKGGEEALRAIESVRVTGTMSMNGGQMTAPFVWMWKAPDRLRLEFTLQGMTGVQAYDGADGWMVMPFMGKTEAEAMPAEQVKEFAEQADFDGPFIDSEEKGYVLAYLGEAEVDGTPAYKVQVTNKHGDVTFLYLDKDYGLEIQSESKRTMHGQEVESVTAIGDYKEVGGIMMAHSFDAKLKGMPIGGQTLTFDSVEFGVELPDSQFEMPAAAPAAGGETKEQEGGGAR